MNLFRLNQYIYTLYPKHKVSRLSSVRDIYTERRNPPRIKKKLGGKYTDFGTPSDLATKHFAFSEQKILSSTSWETVFLIC